MRDGVIEKTGLPLEFYNRPANLFVAGFIGSPSMNLINGKIRIDGKPSVVTDNGVSLPLASAPNGSAGCPCIYGVRPEHLGLGWRSARADFGGGTERVGDAGVGEAGPTARSSLSCARHRGQARRTALDFAEARLRTSVRPGESRRISSASVPWPATVAGSAKGWK